MNNIKNKFCHNCGSKLINVAKFCPECGTSQASLSAKPPEPEPAPVKKNPSKTSFAPMSSDGEDDDDSYVDHLESLEISISSLDVDYGRPGMVGKETIGSIMKQGAILPPNSDDYIRSTPESVDAKAFLDQFRQEGGTLRSK